ncbi:MAG: GDSL-type esterase/lipase family protein [Candidatus Limnocylindrales bacterium]
MSSIRGRDPSGGSIRDRAAQGQAAQVGRPAGARRISWIPGWLRAILFYPATPRPMAHLDPHHVAESSRHMARPAAGSVGGEGAALATAAAELGRRFLPKEPRRREMLGVLMLLMIASLISVTGPIAGAGAASSTPNNEIAANVNADPSPTPTETVNPEDTASPDITPAPTATPTAKPKPKPAPAKKATPKPVKVRSFVALGDSLTAWPDTPWPTRLDAQDTVLKLLHNAGVPGNTTAQMRARLASDVYNYHPDVLFVLGGTNDLGYNIKGSATIANLRAIIVGAKAHKITVILLLVPPDSWTSMAPKINSLNAAIINLANSQKVNYVDIHAPLANGNGVYYPKYTTDGLHFSDLGAQVVANTIRVRIRRLGL